MEEDSVDLILTDPPFNITGRNKSCWDIRPNHIVRSNWDKYSEEEYFELISDFFKLSSNVIKEGGTLVTFCNVKDISYFIKIAEENGFYYKNALTWHKTNPFPGNMNLHFVSATEYFLYFTYKKKTGTFNNEGKIIHNYIETCVTPRSEKIYGKHQTQKPLELVRWLIELLSNENDIVLDPFMGTGTTCVSCKQLGRKYIGIEKELEFYEIANKRLSD